MSLSESKEQRRMFSRRDFIKSMFLTLGAVKATELAARLYHHETTKHRRLHPHERAHIIPGSVRFGIAPDLNTIQVPPEAHAIYEASDIINLFLECETAYGEDLIKMIIAQQKLPLISLTHGAPILDLRKMDMLYPSLKERAERYRRLGPIAVRPLFEANGEWMPYGSQHNSPADFCKAFEFISTVFQERAPNVKLILSLNTHRPVRHYLPNPDSYHAIGWDFYNKYKPYSPRILNPDFDIDRLFAEEAALVQEMLPDKAFFIAETGVEKYEGAADWLHNTLMRASLYEGLTAVMLFCWNKADPLSYHEADWSKMVTDLDQQRAILGVLEKNQAYQHTGNDPEQILFDLITRRG